MNSPMSPDDFRDGIAREPIVAVSGGLVVDPLRGGADA
jgi:hypothetical protein